MLQCRRGTPSARLLPAFAAAAIIPAAGEVPRRTALPVQAGELVLMSIYELKPRFQSLLRPFVARLAGAGVTANQVTLAALALSLLGGAAIAMGPGVRAVLLLLPLLLLVRMALNAVDGMLAREHGQISALGGLLNELGDLVSDSRRSTTPA